MRRWLALVPAWVLGLGACINACSSPLTVAEWRDAAPEIDAGSDATTVTSPGFVDAGETSSDASGEREPLHDPVDAPVD